jgi:hypothetical protein
MASIASILILCQAATSANDPFFRVARAIMQVESGGDPCAVGDGGRAIGPYQIHRAYWADGTRFLGVDWPYERARCPVASLAVVRAYTQHYARHYKRPWDAETISRIHNGGPRGWQKAATVRYWAKVRAAMGE